jgi:glutamyl-tRNA reductase
MASAFPGKKLCDGPPIEVRLVGLNHQTAPTEVREALAYSESEIGRWIRLSVEQDAIDLGGPRVKEAALLCTCNRTEAYVVLSVPPEMPREADLRQRLARLLCGERLDALARNDDVLYQRQGSDAAHHLLRVASGLDSMVQGEQQILGQVHQAHELAREAHGIGPILDRLFSSAFRAGKRARSETDIGRGTVSVAGAAVELASKVVGSLARRSVAVVGAGETGRLVAQHLAAENPHDLVILNRTAERAERLAREVNGRAAPLDALGGILARMDLVVVAASAPQPIVTRAQVQPALRHRPRSLVFIDISVPRNVEPAVHQLDGAFLYDLDALQQIVRENLLKRQEEVPKVERILEEEMEQFCRWFRSLAAGPLIAELRDRFEQIRQGEIERHARHLGPKEREAAERATRGLLNKLLHGPTVHLRNGGSSDVEAVELIRRVFQLDLAPGAADGDAPAARTDAADAGPDPAGTESGRAPGRTESPS